jgi:hypothetical protein
MKRIIRFKVLIHFFPLSHRQTVKGTFLDNSNHIKIKSSSTSDGALINCLRQPGQLHSDTNTRPLIETLQKPCHRDTDGN